MKKFKRALAVLLAISLLLTTLSIGCFATTLENLTEEPTSAEEGTGGANAHKSQLGIKITSDKKNYGTDETVVFTITVTNKGKYTAEDVYVDSRSNKHLSLENDRHTIQIGTIPAGESVSVTLNAEYWTEPNTTSASYLMMRMLTPIYESIFAITVYFIPLFSRSSTACTVHFENAKAGVDNDYSIISTVKYGEIPTTAAPAEAPTEAPTEEPTIPGMPVNPADNEPTEAPTEEPGSFLPGA